MKKRSIIYFLPLLLACQDKELNLSPGTFTVDVNQITDSSAQIIWSASIDSEGDSVSYEIFINGSSIVKDLIDLSYVASNLGEATPYEGMVVASDPLGNTNSIDFRFTTDSTQLNRAPSAFDVQIVNSEKTAAYIHWTKAIDPEGDSVTYDIFLNDQPIKTKLKGTYYALSGLGPNMEYSGAVVASDPFGNKQRAVYTLHTASFKTVFEGNVFLKSQTDVVAFSQEPYRTITGDLFIGGGCTGPSWDLSCHEAVSDLSPLVGLTKINGTLTIQYSGLHNFHGLDSLKEIGSMLISENSHHTDFSGFESLETVLGNVIIEQAEHTSFQGFNNLSSIKGDLSLRGNRNIKTLSGFTNLKTIGGNLIIQLDAQLANLTGMESIQSIDGNVTMSLNSSLKDFCILRDWLNEGKIKGDISINSNTSKADLMAGNCRQ
jgi:hypothetical protein